MLELKISIEENCDSLYLFECTGKYDRDCNAGGWGGLNGQTRNATSAYYEIYPPGSTTPLVYTLSTDFPSDCKLGYELFPSNLSMEAFASGIWKFEYYVLMNDQTLHKATCTVFLTKDLECCIGGKQINVDIDNFESREVANASKLFNLFESAKKNACIGNENKVIEIVDYLYAKCRCNCG